MGDAGLHGQVDQIADPLPPGTTWDDVIKQARFRNAVQEGIAAADRGEFASEADVRRVFRKWGVKVAA